MNYNIFWLEREATDANAERARQAKKRDLVQKAREATKKRTK